MKHFTSIAAVVFAAFGLNAALSANTKQLKNITAVFFQKDPAFSETVTLYADGKYQQSETQLAAYPPGTLSQHTIYPTPALSVWCRNPKREGTWRILDKEGGLPVAIKKGEGLPSNMVVELKGAMPFGMTWDNVLPYTSHGDRVLPTASFQAALPTPQAR